MSEVMTGQAPECCISCTGKSHIISAVKNPVIQITHFDLFLFKVFQFGS